PSGTQNNSSTQSDSTTTGNQAGAGANPGTIRGCLGGSPSSGTYYVTDSQTGTTYTLMGSADQLRTHVGQEVEITGQAMGSGMPANSNTSDSSSNANSTSGAGASASASSNTGSSTAGTK